MTSSAPIGLNPATYGEVRDEGRGKSATDLADRTDRMDRMDRPQLLRRSDDVWLAGVAGGIADHLGIPVIRVRFAFLVLGSLGAVLYAVFWIVLPSEAGRTGAAHRFVKARFIGALFIVAMGVVIGLFWAATKTDMVQPPVIALIGGALIWRQATESQRADWRRLSHHSLTSSSSAARLRLVVGLALVVLGGALLLPRGNLGAVRDGLFAVLVTVVGIALVTGPWWVGLLTQLSTERRERIRSHERAERAARVHDSVLQTLALIQRNADSPKEVNRLARGQERELRALLYGPAETSGNLAHAVRNAAAEIEDSYAISVDAVVVGDTSLTPGMAALVGACREAMQNAAKHSRSVSVSLYVEVTDDAVDAFVRDRGIGFDPAAIGEDRQGVRQSIIGRMERHGGTATVGSGPLGGTEVRMRMPR